MTIFELLKNPIFDLPKYHNNRSYEMLFMDTMNEYCALLSELEDFDIHQEHSRKIDANEIFNKALNLGKGIIRTLTESNNGRPYKAFDEFKTILDESDFVYKTEILMGGEDLYRVRVSNNNYSFSKDEIFHIPFHLKNIIPTQRYSIPGFPCLYLSDSVYTCWEEMKRPDINSLHASRFRNNKVSQVLLIPNPKEEIEMYAQEDKIVEGVIGIGIDSLLANFPLYLACSVGVQNPKDPFKIEYIIPQLLLQYVRQSNEVQGVKYFSTNIDYSNGNISGTFNNYVFPVKTLDTKGFCKGLEEAFTFTEPLSNGMIQNGGTTVLYQKGELDSIHVKKIELVKGRAIPYSDSPFAFMELNLSWSKTEKRN